MPLCPFLMAVALIETPGVDWKALCALAQRGLNRSITTTADRTIGNVSQSARFASALAEFAGTAPVKSIPQCIADHKEIYGLLNFTFVTGLDDDSLFALLSLNTALKCLPANGAPLIIVGGDLNAWVATVLACCKKHQPFELVEFGTHVLKTFDALGLGAAWTDWKRMPAPANTLYLEKK